MTSTAISADHLLDLIHQTGYWRVIVHPTIFEQTRIPTPGDCWRIVEESRVSQRGWDYPYVNRNDRVIQGNWVQCGIAFGNLIEIWRLYQSGQFLHHFAVSEDREEPGFMNGNRDPSAMVDGPRTLSIFNLVYTLSEIMEFARRLGHHDVLGPAAKIRVELHGMSGRHLTAPQSTLQIRMPLDEYVSHADTISWEHTSPTAALIATAPKIALDATMHVLERFQWTDPPLRILEDRQRRFYQKQW